MTFASKPDAPPDSKLAQLDRFLEQDPTNPGLLREAFAVAMSAGNFTRAEGYLSRANALGADAVQWALNAVHLAMARSEWPKAQGLLNALATTGNIPPTLATTLAHDQAVIDFMQDRDAQALAALQPLVEQEASSDWRMPTATQVLLLRVWHRSLAFEAAMPWARAHADAGAFDAAALGVASLLALDAGDLEASERWARSALESGQANAEALVAASALALMEHDAESAERFARLALQRNDRESRSWASLGMARFAQQDIVEANDCLARSVDASPTHATTMLLLGWTEFLLQRVEDAARTFARAIDLDRGFAECHGALAVAQAQLGRVDEANVSLERALRLDRDCASAQFAKMLLEGNGPLDGAQVRRLGRRLLEHRVSPAGVPLSAWLPDDDPQA